MTLSQIKLASAHADPVVRFEENNFAVRPPAPSLPLPIDESPTSHPPFMNSMVTMKSFASVSPPRPPLPTTTSSSSPNIYLEDVVRWRRRGFQKENDPHWENERKEQATQEMEPSWCGPLLWIGPIRVRISSSGRHQRPFRVDCRRQVMTKSNVIWSGWNRKKRYPLLIVNATSRLKI